MVYLKWKTESTVLLSLTSCKCLGYKGLGNGVDVKAATGGDGGNGTYTDKHGRTQTGTDADRVDEG